jgi:hypothetical protein
LAPALAAGWVIGHCRWLEVVLVVGHDRRVGFVVDRTRRAA